MFFSEIFSPCFPELNRNQQYLQTSFHQQSSFFRNQEHSHQLGLGSPEINQPSRLPIENLEIYIIYAGRTHPKNYAH
jgi:hypothetical protein